MNPGKHNPNGRKEGKGMKRTRIWFSILCALVMLMGCFALGESPESADGVPTEADCGSLRIRIEGPDARMPLEISYAEFTDGSFSLTGLQPGEYTVTEIAPEELLEGFSLQEDSEIKTTVTVKSDGEVTAALFNHYAPEEKPEDEEPEEEPAKEAKETGYVSVSVRKEWDDNGDVMGLRPDSVTVTLSNGSTYVLYEGNEWSVTVENLPDRIDGQPVTYTWTEQEVPGYVLAETKVDGTETTLVNRLWMPPQPPEGQKPPKTTGETWYVFDDYDTPLGLEIMINHVGDCFE